MIYKVVKNMQLEPDFWLSEFVCPDGSGEVYVDYELRQKIQRMRAIVDSSIIVVSGYRNATYNKKIGGAVNSQHLYGLAADIKCPAWKVWNFMLLAEELGFGGIGIYDTAIHVDVRPMVQKSRWFGVDRKNTPEEVKYFIEHGFTGWKHSNVTK